MSIAYNTWEVGIEWDQTNQPLEKVQSIFSAGIFIS